MSEPVTGLYCSPLVYPFSQTPLSLLLNIFIISLDRASSSTLYFFKIASQLSLVLCSSKSNLGSDCLIPNKTKHNTLLDFNWNSIDEMDIFMISNALLYSFPFVWRVLIISSPSVSPLISSSAPLSNPLYFDWNIACFLFLIVASVSYSSYLFQRSPNSSNAWR